MKSKGLKKKEIGRKQIIKNKGITLIALVITIIVLLILAGVSIATLTGENGILNQASKAGEETKKAAEKEQVSLAFNTALSDNLGKTITENNLRIELQKYDENIIVTPEGNSFKVSFPSGNVYSVSSSGTVEKYEQFEESKTIDGKTMSSKNNPIIPKGFKPIDEGEAVWGDGKQPPKEESVNNGLVIEDIDHNQFVWVPVNSDKFERVAGYRNATKQSWSETDYTEPYEKGYLTEKDEYNKMYSSVTTNGGFYIGRFEAGKDSNGNVVVQKGVDVYNNIKWGNAMNDATGEGAVEKAKGFKEGKVYEKVVTSTLVYGIQWDATMQFFDSNYIDGIPEEKIQNSYVSNSTGKGNYNEKENTNEWKGQIAKTGSSLDYKVKNIYDMAGNIHEWTMEACGTIRTNRGGYYTATGTFSPASYRGCNNPFDSFEHLGFRIALYVEM